MTLTLTWDELVDLYPGLAQTYNNIHPATPQYPYPKMMAIGGYSRTEKHPTSIAVMFAHENTPPAVDIVSYSGGNFPEYNPCANFHEIIFPPGVNLTLPVGHRRRGGANAGSESCFNWAVHWIPPTHSSRVVANYAWTTVLNKLIFPHGQYPALEHVFEPIENDDGSITYNDKTYYPKRCAGAPRLGRKIQKLPWGHY